MKRFLLPIAATTLLFSLSTFAYEGLSPELAQEVVVDSAYWRANQPDTEYVVQLISVLKTKHLPSASDVRALKAVDPSRDIVYYLDESTRLARHTLLWGIFDTKAEGVAKFKYMPASWQKMQPWVRPLTQIQGAIPVAVVEPEPIPEPVVAPTTPQLTAEEVEALREAAAQASTPKHPVSPPDRSMFPKKPLPPIDPYENFGEDLSNHESAIAAQGTYPYAKLSLGTISQDTEGLNAAAQQQGFVLNNLEDSYDGTAYEFALGMDIGFYLGLELGYLDGQNIEININNRKEEMGFTGMKASALVKLPIDANRRRQIQPFVQVGGIKWKAETPSFNGTNKQTIKDTDLFYAAGVDYKLTKHWALGLKYSHYDIEAAEARSATVDITWRWEGRN